jgi:hypothetical protein
MPLSYSKSGGRGAKRFASVGEVLTFSSFSRAMGTRFAFVMKTLDYQIPPGEIRVCQKCGRDVVRLEGKLRNFQEKVAPKYQKNRTVSLKAQMKQDIDTISKSKV